MTAPKLRFKEFDGDWGKQRLDSFLERVSNPVDVIADQQYTQIGIRSHGKGIFHKESIDGKGLGNKRVFWVEPNAFVVNIVFAWERAIAVTSDAENGMIASHRFPMYLPKNNLSNVNFLRYLFVTDKGQSYLELASPGGAGRNKTLGQSNFAELKIDLPSLEEQTKIAFFLSAVDKKISQLSQKHSLLSQYKQGMMQKLFSQKIRFKADDGSEFGEWEETTLGKIAKNISAGATPSTLKEEYWGGHIKWMSSGELNYKYVYNVEKTITELGFKFSSTKLLPKYCVLIGLAGQGKTRGTVAINYIELCTNQSIAAIHPNPKVFDHRFIFFNLDMRYQELRGLSTGDGGRGGLNLQIIKGVELELPCLEEQTKIANFLSNIDQKIEVVAQQIEQAKQWKKGLLQQMFV